MTLQATQYKYNPNYKALLIILGRFKQPEYVQNSSNLREITRAFLNSARLRFSSSTFSKCY